jgi:hypothetical protein
MNAHASADRKSGWADMRVCALVIAHSPCTSFLCLSSDKARDKTDEHL